MAIHAKTAVPSAAANGKHGHSLISDEKFRQLYGLALRLHLLVGHAAALAGVAADLRNGDLLIPGEKMGDVAALRGILPSHLVRPNQEIDAGKRVIEAVTAAVQYRLNKSGNVAVIFFPPAVAAAQMQEARVLADRARLPVLFVEEPPEPAKPAQAANVIGRAGQLDMPSIPVDAQDVIAMYRVAHESIVRAREGTGPTRILCVKPPAAIGGKEDFRSADAVASLEHWLVARGLPAQEWRQAITEQSKRN
jgi:Dehydrogenase E1 component